MSKNKYQASYDVIVLGFGGAGATAARFAADNGAKVLVVDSAPYGHEGGNTRYSAQLVGTGDDYDKLYKYYSKLTSPKDLPESMKKVYVKGMVHMREYFKKYLVDKPVDMKRDFDMKSSHLAVTDFPEYEGGDTYDFTAVTPAIFNAALWKVLQQKVLDRKDKIDVWLNSPAEHMLRNPETGVVEGAEIKRNGDLVKVLAKKGVVLTTGGFENNQEMVQNYLGVTRAYPLGSVYNKGAGVRMASEVGAKLWHMWNFEELGLFHGLSFHVQGDDRVRLYLGWPQLHEGSILVVGNDGSRYFREDETNRHGHLYNHGDWKIPVIQEHPALIFDQTQLDFIHKHDIPASDFDKRLIKAASISELAKKIDVDAKILANTVRDFNKSADNGYDPAFKRDAKTMRAFDQGPYYAIKMVPDILNTQGGPERNAKAEILDTENKPIPHLFGAGELGGICANEYQGGGNLAECLIFGKIAGENAAKVENNVQAEASQDLNGSNDLAQGAKKDISLGNNQYLGSSEKGIGGKVTVRVTYQQKKISNVEIVDEHESEDVAQKALKVIPQEIVKNNSVDVDSVSGASTTSRAIKEAVDNALKKAKK